MRVKTHEAVPNWSRTPSDGIGPDRKLLETLLHDITESTQKSTYKKVLEKVKRD